MTCSISMKQTCGEETRKKFKFQQQILLQLSPICTQCKNVSIIVLFCVFKSCRFLKLFAATWPFCLAASWPWHWAVSGLTVTHALLYCCALHINIFLSSGNITLKEFWILCWIFDFLSFCPYVLAWPMGKLGLEHWNRYFSCPSLGIINWLKKNSNSTQFIQGFLSR